MGPGVTPVKLLGVVAAPAVVSWVNLIAQVDTGSGGGSGATTTAAIAGIAASASSAALAIVVRQFLGGNLVHRSVAEVEKRLTDDRAQADQRHAELMSQVLELVKDSHQREDTYRTMLLEAATRQGPR